MRRRLPNLNRDRRQRFSSIEPGAVYNKPSFSGLGILALGHGVGAHNSPTLRLTAHPPWASRIPTCPKPYITQSVSPNQDGSKFAHSLPETSLSTPYLRIRSPLRHLVSPLALLARPKRTGDASERGFAAYITAGDGDGDRSPIRPPVSLHALPACA